MGLSSSKKLFISCKNRDLKALKAFTGKNINKKYFPGMTPLFFAIKFGNYDVVNFLIHRGADVTVEDNYKCTPLEIAHQEYPEVIPLLIAHGALTNLSVSDKQMLLMSQILLNGNNNLVAVVEHVETLNYGGISHPLIMAADFADLDVIRVLVQHGADVNYSVKDPPNSPVQIAIDKDRLTIAKLLLEFGANYEMSSYPYHTVRMEELLFFHNIKLRSLKLYVYPNDLELLRMKREYDSFARDCDKEVVALKQTRISDITNVSFYHILYRKVDHVTTVLRNEKIRSDLAKLDIYEMFPIYFSMLDLRIELCIAKANRINECFRLIRSILFGVRKIPDECVDHVLKCFSEDDLRLLVVRFRTCKDCIKMKQLINNVK